MSHWDSLWINIHLATMTNGYGEINDAALAVRDGKIVWLGERNALPANYSVTTQHDGAGCWVTPGLIDCHTHLVYAGNRSNEFEARLNGVSYETIARRAAVSLYRQGDQSRDEDELLQATLPRLRALLSEGVTTLEIKSGYGLDLPSEARLLRVARRIGREFPVRVKTLFWERMPCHRNMQVGQMITSRWCASTCCQHWWRKNWWMRLMSFAKKSVYSAQTERVFLAAQARFAGEAACRAIIRSGWGGVNCALSRLSADHLEYLSDAGIGAMAASGTVAVLLPGAFIFYVRRKCHRCRPYVLPV
jgi:imidazolonepropionase